MFNLSGSAEQFENSDESVCEEVLRKALDHEEDEDVMYISDEEMSQVKWVVLIPCMSLLSYVPLASK